MSDIESLQQEWQEKSAPLLADINVMTEKYKADAAALTALVEKLKQMHGLSRLKKPFIRATKTAPLFHKIMRLGLKANEKSQQLSAVSQNILSKLDKIAVESSRSSTEYNL